MIFLQLWSDLGLTALFRSCEHHLESERNAVFQLYIGLQRRIISQRNVAKVGKMPPSTQTLHETEPPTSIEAAVLSSINLSLEYTRSQSSKYTPSCAGNDVCTGMLAQNPRMNTSDCSPQSLEMTRAMCLEEADCSQMIENSILAHIEGSPGVESGLHNLREKWDTFSSSALNNNGHSEWDYDASRFMSDFHKLFDSSLRDFIISDLPMFDVGITKYSDGPLKYLSEIAPAVFNLGYHEVSNATLKDSERRCPGYFVTDCFLK